MEFPSVPAGGRSPRKTAAKLAVREGPRLLGRCCLSFSLRLAAAGISRFPVAAFNNLRQESSFALFRLWQMSSAKPPGLQAPSIFARIYAGSTFALFHGAFVYFIYRFYSRQ